MPGVRIPDLSGYYRIDAPEEQLEMIANKLRATDEVRAAYIKPASEPAYLNAMAPSMTSAPRRTPTLEPGRIISTPLQLELMPSMPGPTLEEKGKTSKS